MEKIDLRSDTVTHPTEKMRQLMATAPVGDDVYGDDETVIRLEKTAAELLGKEAAMFVPSGVFGNQVSVLTHTKRAQEIILGEKCHIIEHEAGSVALISNVQTRTIDDSTGEMDPREVERIIRKAEDIHFPHTGLICVETAHSTGNVASLENLQEIRAIAKKHGIPVHLDGARLFNAATYLGVEGKDIAEHADSISLCLSKGLCAPVGSVVAGTKAFIHEARKNRKILGGGMRQAGILAAAGLEALEMRKRLKEDHDNALYFGEELDKIPGIRVHKDAIKINMIFFDIEKENFDDEKFVSHLKDRDILINGQDGGLYRFVTHYYITRERMDAVLEILREYFR
ncbi:low-specificity L-threonine aldolase [Proteiniclasticum sp. SCR006]|uniref:Low-specificity L-threonine aldolase n=1 Tax=Proteiniclasticum aestuarii TaxID=2817862 RepID=A0A939KIW1_9CLOT|nr:low-specificity L-threonine aldolase [Proteiniclasticum aestuarii]MBO1264406.1 low-specificity L-threonine aldolase [Proteiniclasticum aestuarii]